MDRNAHGNGIGRRARSAAATPDAGDRRRRRCRARALACALACALATCGGLAGCGGMGAVVRSGLDRILPGPELTMYARSPEPDSFLGAYGDATGAGSNFVYLVPASDSAGNVRELQIICFGEKADGEGWLRIEAKGGSGIRYRGVEEGDVPKPALDALA